ncbi:MAG TPA: NUDIX domain-containing protein [Candidatus Paceibacterota bacterium]|nr:NUDIX domain-containing protein [Candidatus Pacearchaeota archaeon]HRZ50997.1 NUDIX domain-containing protein [Candidatus Paceibacterota bacterium]HSA36718.1 NUDIX domain-containing protein [Candidatus Paceibacterota bacterium]
MAEVKGEEAPKKTSSTAKPAMGLFAAISDGQGRLLVKRRQPWESFPGDWDLPGGAFDLEEAERALDESVIGRALCREVLEETGIDIEPWDIENMPAMFPALLKGGKDIGYLIIIGRYDVEPILGEWRYVNTKELLELCANPKGNQLVSGFGKRMCRLCLKALTLSSDAESAALARSKLAECYE